MHDPVNIVQHPKGELKQIAIRNNTLLDLPEDSGLDKFAHYETDTEQGSSGSPVLNDQWEVLHHSGIPRTNAINEILDRDGNVWPDNGDPDNIDWVANEGIRTSHLAAFIKGARVREHEKALQTQFTAISSGDVVSSALAPKPSPETTTVKSAPASLTPRPTPAQDPRRTASPAPLSAASGNGTVSLTLPLMIHISLGTVQASAHAKVTVAADGAMLEAAIAPDPDYLNRPGFDPTFLEFEAPLPTLMPEVRDLALPVGDGIELKYYHHSVIMNAQRKLAFVSAVNLDAGAPFQLARKGKDLAGSMTPASTATSNSGPNSTPTIRSTAGTSPGEPMQPGVPQKERHNLPTTIPSIGLIARLSLKCSTRVPRPTSAVFCCGGRWRTT